MDASLKRTPLYDWHVSHGGRMVPFAGWELPVRYAGVIEEHHLVRRSVGLFDIDHMGQFSVAGPGAQAFLHSLVSSSVADLAVGQSRYGLLCLPSGGVIDDVFVYRRPTDWFVVVNAANRAKDWDWFQAHSSPGVILTDLSDALAMVAVQGPRAVDVVASLTEDDLRSLPRLASTTTRLAGVETFVGRTGYTGEDGVELFFDARAALTVWEALLSAGRDRGVEVGPVGLGARDSLRFEPGYSLYGHEITETISPLEAGLGWACDLTKDFVGRDALVAQKKAGLPRKLVAFRLTEPGVAREGCRVESPQGEPLGVVVTGLYSPTLAGNYGHAFVPLDHSAPGSPLVIVIRDQPKTAVVVARPLYRRSAL